ncbi:TPA: hypothetical protein ACHJ4I_003759, partial [Escherichia coli]
RLSYQFSSDGYIRRSVYAYDYLANYQTGVTRPTENTGEVITRWQRKSGFFDVSHNVFDNKAL